MLTNWGRQTRSKFSKPTLIQNGVWGIMSNILQTLFVCLFFAIVARKYPANEFARFLISNTVYQIVAAFSSMGLGQWFIRQYAVEEDKITLTSKFLKTQAGLGLLFYLVNIVLAFSIYQDGRIILLCVILGTNIIFDNFINALRNLNIAEGKQYKTALILVIDGFFKLLIGCMLFIQPFSSVVLSVLMIVIRILTLSLFIKLGSSNSISLNLLIKAKISVEDLKQLIVKNWQFIVIGSISIIYWKIGNIIISKVLVLSNVAEYEISFRIFSVLQILPVVASATIYPQFIKLYNEKKIPELRELYKNIFMGYMVFAVIAYTFMYSFAPVIIPFAFGNHYPGAVVCLQQMFLTYLLLPTVLLQANLIVTIGLEKMDMWFNVVSLFINIVGCLLGLYFVKNLLAVNYSVFVSFLVFHLLQDIVLIRRKFMNVKHCLSFYAAISLTIFCSYHFIGHLNPVVFFLSYSFAFALFSIIVLFFNKSKIGVSLGSLLRSFSRT
jgi:O-antigen/teichoic acid export membrane protein